MANNGLILCIEDNPLHAKIVYKVLQHAGYEVIGASDGKTGITLAQSERPDLILTDFNLPDINGFEVVRTLRTIEQLADIPIIMLTANNMDGDRELSLEAGCNAYLTKPVVRIELLNTIKYILSDSYEQHG